MIQGLPNNLPTYDLATGTTADKKIDSGTIAVPEYAVMLPPDDPPVVYPMYAITPPDDPVVYPKYAVTPPDDPVVTPLYAVQPPPQENPTVPDALEKIQQLLEDLVKELMTLLRAFFNRPQ